MVLSEIHENLDINFDGNNGKRLKFVDCPQRFTLRGAARTDVQ
jgi:hypothetical protein